MNKFLAKLERQAAQFLSTMDGQIQEPIVKVISGDVFKETLESNQAEAKLNSESSDKPKRSR